MSQSMSPKELRNEIIGRTIAGVIARPGGAGEPPVVLMMRFDDGNVIEFVSPRSDRLLRRSLGRSAASKDISEASWQASQLSFDGLLAGGGTC